MEVGGQVVDLKKITMPLLNYYGKYDHLVPPEACEPLISKVGSKDTENVCLDTGHIGIYVSSKCQKEFVPRIAQWLKQRETDQKKRKTKPPSRKKRVAKTTATQSKPALKTKKNK
jgi:polyhydroxyalkanoate synthase